MIKLLAFVVIAVVLLLVLYVAWKYVTGKKYRKSAPKARFFSGPLDGQRLIIGPYKDELLFALPSFVDEGRFALYYHAGGGNYWFDSEVWESEVNLHETKVIESSP